MERRAIIDCREKKRHGASQNKYAKNAATTERDEKVYHVMLRGIDGKPLFLKDGDYRKFLFLLNKRLTEFKASLYGFVLMTNHVHLQIKSNNIKSLVNELSSGYTGFYVNTYKVYTALFEAPKIVEKISDEFQAENLWYILNNPVKEGLSKTPGGYKYSSYMFYTKRKTKISDLINVDCSFIKYYYKSINELNADLREDLRGSKSKKKFRKSYGLKYNGWNKWSGDSNKKQV